MKRYIIATVSLFIASGSLSAQSVEEIKRISEHNYSLSTARSAAMGGAFTSLGADAASMDINPAGLGMSRRSEVTLTPSVGIGSISSTSIHNGFSSITEKARRGTFNLNNLSGIINLIDEPDAPILKTLTLGIGFNQTANYRAETKARSNMSNISISDMWGVRLYGVDPSTLLNDADIYQPYRNYSPYFWGGILAYQSGMIFEQIDNLGYYKYQPYYYDENGNMIGSLLPGDAVIPSFKSVTNGVNGNYSVSLGMKLGKSIYLGTTLGYQNFNYSRDDYYQESGLISNSGDLEQMRYNQYLTQNGGAFSFKLGVIAEPVKGLKLGVSVHAPMLYSVNEEYYADMDNFYRGLQNYSAKTAYLVNDYTVKTPTRLNTGISYTFGKRGVISFDYERVWYNKMRVKGIDYMPGEVTMDNEISMRYKASDNFRVGAEFNVISGLFLRAGYAYYGNADKLNDKKYGVMQNYSGGLGFRNNRFTVDLAYVYNHRELAPYRYFSEQFSESFTIESPSYINTKAINSNIILTLGVRF